MAPAVDPVGAHVRETTMQTVKSGIAIALALIATLCVNGPASAGYGAGDPPGIAEDTGGANAAKPSDDPPGDDKGTSGGNSSPAEGERGRLGARLNQTSSIFVGTNFSYQLTAQLKQLKGVLKIKLPDKSTGIAGRASAEDALITGTLSRKGKKNGKTVEQNYAECTFSFARIEGGKAIYTFLVKVNPKNPNSVRQQKGSCDIRLGMPGIQPGVPNVLPSDIVLVKFHFDSPPPGGADTITLGRGHF